MWRLRGDWLARGQERAVREEEIRGGEERGGEGKG